ncbi:MAG: hypothetical protein ABIT76_08850 [Chthoniobacterales bacterium]
MSTPIDKSADLSGRILARLKARFYAGHEKLYFQELAMLQQAISLPAVYLEERSRALPAERLESILLTVIRGIVENARPEDIHSFGRYFLKAVQTHMNHHGEEYLAAAKSYQSVLEHQLMGLRKVGEKALPFDKTCESLAAAHKVLTQKSGRKKAQKTQCHQIDLL